MACLYSRVFSALLVSLCLSGCAGLSQRIDPASQLAQAVGLFSLQEKPLLAERLILESIAVCDARGDMACLADGYRVYAFFFGSMAVEGRWRLHYQVNGFLDPLATFERRHAKAAEYFGKSRGILVGLEQFEAARNLSLNMAQSYRVLGDFSRTCRLFDDAAVFHAAALRRDPRVELVWPVEFSTFDDWLAAEKRRTGCV